MSAESTKPMTLTKAAERLRRKGQSVMSCYYSIRHAMRQNYWRPSDFAGHCYLVTEAELPVLREVLARMRGGRPASYKPRTRGMYLRPADGARAQESTSDRGVPESAAE